MPQGKLKVKAKKPAGKAKKKATKGPAKKNRPIAPKKQQQKEAQKLKKVVSKTINQAMEDELRGKALDGKKSLTNKKETPKKAAKGRKGKK